MKRSIFSLILVLAGCAVHPQLYDSGAPLADVDGGPHRNAICAAGLARHQELGCTTRGVLACPVVWDGAEQCDAERETACLERLTAAPDCIALSIAWRGDCIIACNPTTP